MNARLSRRPMSRRRLLQSAGAWALASPLLAAASAALAQQMPAIPALTSFLAGRSPRWEHLRLELPALADNGQAVPMRLTMAGPFAPGTALKSIHLYSEVNPVPEMAVFEFPSPPPKVEIDSSVRLAGSQRAVAAAILRNGGLFAAGVGGIVTIAARIHGG